ncbi:MAG: hypothetical protein HRT99_03835 [Mycoplasmatales bacterium]|nr:hypothetical protein [Mycoplasmatales bacterium]
MPTPRSLLAQMNPNGVDGKGNFSLPHIDHIVVVSNKTSGQLSNGDVTFTLTPDDGYVWEDGTNEVKTVVVNVNNLNSNSSSRLTLPTSQALLAQMNPNGIDGKGVFSLPQFDHVVVVSNKTSGQLSNGDVTFTLTPEGDYVWEDGTNEAKTVVVNVDNLLSKKLNLPSANDLLTKMDPWGQNGSAIFTLPKFNHITVVSNKTSGQLSNGDVTFTLTPKDTFTWKDGTNTPKNVIVNVTNLSDTPVQAQYLYTSQIAKPNFELNMENENWNISGFAKLKTDQDIQEYIGSVSYSIHDKQNNEWLDFDPDVDVINVHDEIKITYTLKNGFEFSGSKRKISFTNTFYYLLKENKDVIALPPSQREMKFVKSDGLGELVPFEKNDLIKREYIFKKGLSIERYGTIKNTLKNGYKISMQVKTKNKNARFKDEYVILTPSQNSANNFNNIHGHHLSFKVNDKIYFNDSSNQPGLYYHNSGAIQREIVPSSRQYYFDNSLLVENNNIMYLGTKNNGIVSFNPTNNRFNQISQKDSNEGFAIKSNNKIYFGLKDGLYEMINGKLVNLNQNDFSNCKAISNGSLIYILTKNGLKTFDTISNEYRDLVNINNVDLLGSSILKFNNSIYMLMNHSFYEYNLRSSQLNNISGLKNHEHKFGGLSILSGRIMIGSYNGDKYEIYNPKKGVFINNDINLNNTLNNIERKCFNQIKFYQDKGDVFLSSSLGFFKLFRTDILYKTQIVKNLTEVIDHVDIEREKTLKMNNYGTKSIDIKSKFNDFFISDVKQKDNQSINYDSSKKSIENVKMGELTLTVKSNNKVFTNRKNEMKIKIWVKGNKIDLNLPSSVEEIRNFRNATYSILEKSRNGNSTIFSARANDGYSFDDSNTKEIQFEVLNNNQKEIIGNNEFDPTKIVVAGLNGEAKISYPENNKFNVHFSKKNDIWSGDKIKVTLIAKPGYKFNNNLKSLNVDYEANVNQYEVIAKPTIHPRVEQVTYQKSYYSFGFKPTKLWLKKGQIIEANPGNSDNIMIRLRLEGPYNKNVPNLNQKEINEMRIGGIDFTIKLKPNSWNKIQIPEYINIKGAPVTMSNFYRTGFEKSHLSTPRVKFKSDKLYFMPTYEQHKTNYEKFTKEIEKNSESLFINFIGKNLYYEMQKYYLNDMDKRDLLRLDRIIDNWNYFYNESTKLWSYDKRILSLDGEDDSMIKIISSESGLNHVANSYNERVNFLRDGGSRNTPFDDIFSPGLFLHELNHILNNEKFIFDDLEEVVNMWAASQVLNKYTGIIGRFYTNNNYYNSERIGEFLSEKYVDGGNNLIKRIKSDGGYSAAGRMLFDQLVIAYGDEILTRMSSYYHNQFYDELNSKIYAFKNEAPSNIMNLDKKERTKVMFSINSQKGADFFIEAAVKVTKTNLLPFFDKWKLFVSEKMRRKIESYGYPILKTEIWKNFSNEHKDGNYLKPKLQIAPSEVPTEKVKQIKKISYSDYLAISNNHDLVRQYIEIPDTYNYEIAFPKYDWRVSKEFGRFKGDTTDPSGELNFLISTDFQSIKKYKGFKEFAADYKYKFFEMRFWPKNQKKDLTLNTFKKVFYYQD